MKTIRKALTAMVLLAALTWSSAAFSGICLAKPLADLAAKHAQLYKWLYDIQEAAKDRILAGKRWKDKDFPLGEAQADLQASVAKAQDISVSAGGQGPGPETVKAHAEVFTNTRVCEVDKTSLEDAGAGIGYIVKDSGLDDTQIAEMLRRLDNGVLTSKPVFKDMDITVAEVSASVNTLREAGIDIPQGTFGTGGLRQSNTEGATGAAAELLIAGKDVRSGRTVSSFDIDRQDVEYQGAKIDYLIGNDQMVQVGVTLATIENKLDSAMATAIAKAKFLEPNRRYVFKYLDKNGAKPAEATIQAMNARILNPAHWLTSDDFIPVTQIP